MRDKPIPFEMEFPEAGAQWIEMAKTHQGRVQLNRMLNPPHASDKVGRNESCPCGSGKKYKKCCLGKKEEEIESCAKTHS